MSQSTFNINEIRDVFQDCNVNFLIGSGLSTPYLTLLGNIENLLSSLSDQAIAQDKLEIIEASLYKKYFDEVIIKNIEIIEGSASSNDVLNNYKKFLQTTNSVLLNRKSTILSKQANIFTTNIDVFLEKALEDLCLEYNDGFSGRFAPSFNLGNFKKSCFRKSLHYDNTSEIPIFNLIKLHGSLTWEADEKVNKIQFAQKLNLLNEIKKQQIEAGCLIDIPDNANFQALVNLVNGKTSKPSVKAFLDLYKKLLIVNPTKEKFKHTLFNQTYYDLLRVYSNELEKENTVLFAMGFSFADEHIRTLTLRAAQSNPTLIIYIIGRASDSRGRYEEKLGLNNLKNNNIKIITPPQKVNTDKKMVDEFEFRFNNINEEIFDALLKRIEEEPQIVNP